MATRGRKKGGQKTGGRKPGVRNKSVVPQLRKSLADLGFDPAKEIVDLYKSKDADISFKKEILMLIFEYTQVATTAEQVAADEENENTEVKLAAVPTADLLAFTRKPE